MFKKNLYSFCAVLALSCNAYAMEDDLTSSSVEAKGGRSTLRASSASWGSQQDSDETEASASSPASSVPNSLFSNDDAKATFTWSDFMAAVERGEPRAKNLHNFLIEKYMHDEIKWDEKPFYKMPFLQKQLDEDLWSISEPFEAKLAIAVGNIPTTREAIGKLAAAIGHPVNDTLTHKDREIELRIQTLKAVDRVNALKEKISSTEAELEASKAQVAVKEEAEKQLTSQLAALRAEFEAFKVESLEATKAFASVLAKKRAQDQLLQSAIDDVKATLAIAAERLASLPTQASE